MKLTLAFSLLAGATVWAADPTPLDVKTGEWEYNVTMQMTGAAMSGKQMPTIPPETLAKMPPDQRAKVEAALAQAGNMAAGKPTTSTSKHCIKKEDLAKLNPSGNSDKSCKMTVIDSSRSKLDMKEECSSANNKSTSTVSVQAVSSDSMKFSVQSTGTENGQAMNMTVNGTAKWLGASCTDSK